MVSVILSSLKCGLHDSFQPARSQALCNCSGVTSWCFYPGFYFLFFTSTWVSQPKKLPLPSFPEISVSQALHTSSISLMIHSPTFVVIYSLWVPNQSPPFLPTSSLQNSLTMPKTVKSCWEEKGREYGETVARTTETGGDPMKRWTVRHCTKDNCFLISGWVFPASQTPDPRVPVTSSLRHSFPLLSQSLSSGKSCIQPPPEAQPEIPATWDSWWSGELWSLAMLSFQMPPRSHSLAYTGAGLLCPHEPALCHEEDFFPIPNVLGKLSEIFPLLFLEKSYYILSSRIIKNISHFSLFLRKHLAHHLAHLLHEGWMHEQVNGRNTPKEGVCLCYRVRIKIANLEL